MLVKFVSETSVELYRGLVEIDGVIYTNDEEKAKEAGFKPFIKEDTPEAAEGYYCVSYYEDKDDAIYLRWRQEPLPDEEV